MGKLKETGKETWNVPVVIMEVGRAGQSLYNEDEAFLSSSIGSDTKHDGSKDGRQSFRLSEEHHYDDTEYKLLQ